jgi:apolipoprotein N-acyltransferase
MGGLRDLIVDAGALCWMPAVIRTFGELPWIACGAIALALMLYGAGRLAVSAWLAARAAQRGWPRGLAFVLAVTATEAFYPLLFPWYSAVQVHRAPVFMQLAELGGPVLVGVPLAMASVGIAEIAWARIERRGIDRRRVSIALAAPVLMAAYGMWRISAVERAMAEAPALTVGIVQTNTPYQGAPLEQTARAHREATATLQSEHPLDLVVWPEMALSGVIARDALEPTLRALTASPDGVQQTSPAIVTGAIVRHDEALHNSAVLFAGNTVRGVYDKVHPLAFGEYVPFGETFPALYRWIPNAGHLAHGTREEPLLLGDRRISPLICYEDILARESNHAIASAEPDLLIDLTNDAWFGPSDAAVAHLALAEFRAVEHRRYLVRASNSGASAFVDPTGRVTGLTPMLTPATAVESVRWMQSHTLYERIGDLPWCLTALAIVAMGLVARSTLLGGLRRAIHAGGSPPRRAERAFVRSPAGEA